MQITSKLIKIKVPELFDNDFIEAEFLKMGIEPLRWAVVKAEGNILTVSAAFESL